MSTDLSNDQLYMPCPFECGRNIPKSEVRVHFEEGCPDE